MRARVEELRSDTLSIVVTGAPDSIAAAGDSLITMAWDAIESPHLTTILIDLTTDPAVAQPLADKHYCGIGALNLPRQTVVGGSSSDLDAVAAEIETAFPRRRSVRLKTEGAFHTYFMVEAAKRFRPLLAEAEIQAPGTRVLSNYTGGYHDDEPASIRARLFFQLFHPVNWMACLQTALEDEVDTFIEFGGGIGGGEQPAEKRPNLESVIKRAARSAGHETRYLAAINVASIREAVTAGE